MVLEIDERARAAADRKGADLYRELVQGRNESSRCRLSCREKPRDELIASTKQPGRKPPRIH